MTDYPTTSAASRSTDEVRRPVCQNSNIRKHTGNLKEILLEMNDSDVSHHGPQEGFELSEPFVSAWPH